MLPKLLKRYLVASKKKMIVKKRKTKKQIKKVVQDSNVVSSVTQKLDVNVGNTTNTTTATTAATTAATATATATNMPSKFNFPKISNFIVYIHEFDKFDESGNQKCRNHNCMKSVCKPFRKYCSKKCSIQFTKWYNANFYWRNIRNQVLKRDNYTCQICGIVLHRKKRFNKPLKNWLECDHIIPRSYYYHLGYQFDTLDNKVKTILEFIHNGNNLRTLCYKCHKNLSANVVSDRSKLLNPYDDTN
ncbi:MAG: HNH endonuclease [Candidatus Nitrosocosmicus sp.]